MRNDHEALLSELLVLADAVLDRVEGVVQQFAVPSNDSDAPAAPEQHGTSAGCTWCPLCAGAALLRGEDHELVTRLATRLAALIALLRELVSRYLGRTGETDPPEPPPDAPARDRPAYVPISVDVRT
ncbi:hypothetical protein [Rhodococcus sp. CH91]|uniref:hypothetical protein n=1 Tax=Rhodococcus sp. CH91 TaxID=2910256 RepID=UPI0024081794|nr:hypothetical protein [Rhodococcus sp. CH91]